MPSGNTRGQVVGDAAARDVRHPFDRALRDERVDGVQIGAMRRQERVADRPSELLHAAESTVRPRCSNAIRRASE